MLVLGQTDPLEASKAAYARGSAAYEKGDYTTALVSFREAYDKSPADWAKRYYLLYDIAQALYKLGRYAEASTNYSAFLKQAPADDPDRLQATNLLIESLQRAKASPAKTVPTGIIAMTSVAIGLSVAAVVILARR